MFKLLAIFALFFVCYSTRVRIPEAPEAVGSYIRGCYYTDWSHYRPGRGAFWPEDYIKGACTHIFFAFGWMNDDYTVRAYDPADEDCPWCQGGEAGGMFARVVALMKKDSNLKTVLSIGGWTFGTELFKGATQNAQTRATFINSAIAFVRQWGFVGIDIDWEYPNDAVDKVNFVSLFKEFRAAIDKEGKSPKLLLTAAISAGAATIDTGYDVAFAQYLDFANLMSYDFHGAWEDFTGMNSALYGVAGDPIPSFNLDYGARYWVQTKKFPANKLIIGIATYGRGWTLADPNSNGIFAKAKANATATEFVRTEGTACYYEFCEMIAKGAKVVYVKEAEEPYLIYNNDQWFSYEDVQSVKVKMDYVKAGGFGGAFVWCLDYDDFNGQCSNGGGKKYPLISVIAKELSNVVI